MVLLNYRRIFILIELLEGNQPLKVPDLAVQLDCSERSIRYDLDVIDSWLVEKQFPLLVRRHSEGIFYYFHSKEKEKILDEINKLTAREYEFNRKERVDFINLILLTAVNTFTIQRLENLFQVSRATILVDLEYVDKSMAKFHIRLKRQTRKGIWVEGSEINIRQMLIFLNREMNQRSLKILTTDDENGRGRLKKIDFTPSLAAVIDELQVNRIQALVEPLLKFLNIHLSDDGQVALYLHIGMVLKRLRKNRTVSFKDDLIHDIYIKREYQVAMIIKQQIEKAFDMELPEEEVAYIALHLLGNQRSPMFSVHDKRVEDQELFQYILRMTLQVEKIMHAKFENRESLMDGLFLHIRPAIYRSRFGLVIDNPLLDEIRREFTDVYSAVQKSIKEIETDYQVSFTDAEVAYIAMHFCGSLSRLSKTKNYRLKILIICTSGIGTANLLRSRIITTFNHVTVLKTLSYSAFLERDHWDADLIISTIDVPNTKLPFVKVHPLLPEEDYQKLTLYLEPKIKNEQPFTVQELYETIWPVLNKHFTIENPFELTEDLINEFDAFLETKYLKRHAKIHTLEEILVQEFIQLDVEVSCWREAIKTAAKPLERTGAVNEKYKYEIIDIIKERGPYMAVSPGIMLAHGPAQKDHRLALSFTRLSPPIHFGHEKNDPIQLLFMFVSSNEEIQVPALQQLLEHLINKETRNALVSAKNVKQVLSILTS